MIKWSLSILHFYQISHRVGLYYRAADGGQPNVNYVYYMQ